MSVLLHLILGSCGARSQLLLLALQVRDFCARMFQLFIIFGITALFLFTTGTSRRGGNSGRVCTRISKPRMLHHNRHACRHPTRTSSFERTLLCPFEPSDRSDPCSLLFLPACAAPLPLAAAARLFCCTTGSLPLRLREDSDSVPCKRRSNYEQPMPATLAPHATQASARHVGPRPCFVQK